MHLILALVTQTLLSSISEASSTWPHILECLPNPTQYLAHRLSSISAHISSPACLSSFLYPPIYNPSSEKVKHTNSSNHVYDFPHDLPITASCWHALSCLDWGALGEVAIKFATKNCGQCIQAVECVDCSIKMRIHLDGGLTLCILSIQAALSWLYERNSVECWGHARSLPC